MHGPMAFPGVLLPFTNVANSCKKDSATSSYGSEIVKKKTLKTEPQYLPTSQTDQLTFRHNHITKEPHYQQSIKMGSVIS
jgi:hypothetical protein